MRKMNRFERGSGCYVCQACGHRTRRTGDGAGVGVCELCYEIGDCENTMSDNEPESEYYRQAATDLIRLNAQLEARNASKVAKLSQQEG